MALHEAGGTRLLEQLPREHRVDVVVPRDADQRPRDIAREVYLQFDFGLDVVVAGHVSQPASGQPRPRPIRTDA